MSAVGPSLVADSIGVRFGARQVLSAASVRACSGELRVLLGRSGEGKSTLLKVAAGWLAPDSGVVRLDDEARLRWSPAALAKRGLFYLPDHGALGHAIPLERQLRMFAERFPAGDAVSDALARLGIAHAAAMPPHRLSGGEQRRADVAAVFVRRPRVLLADEPLRGIAPIDQERILESFRELARAGCAVVVTGHDVEALLEGADHVTWCTSGTTYELGAPDRARAHEAFSREYLGRR